MGLRNKLGFYLTGWNLGRNLIFEKIKLLTFGIKSSGAQPLYQNKNLVKIELSLIYIVIWHFTINIKIQKQIIWGEARAPWLLNKSAPGVEEWIV